MIRNICLGICLGSFMLGCASTQKQEVSAQVNKERKVSSTYDSARKLNCNNIVVPAYVAEHFKKAGYNPKTYSSISEIPFTFVAFKPGVTVASTSLSTYPGITLIGSADTNGWLYYHNQPRVSTAAQAETAIQFVTNTPVLTINTGSFRKKWDTFIDNDLVDINIPHPTETTFASFDLYDLYEPNRVPVGGRRDKLPYYQDKDTVVVTGIDSYSLGSLHKAFASEKSRVKAIKQGTTELIQSICQ